MSTRTLASVSLLAIGSSGKILIQDHVKTGHITVPGGSIENGESAEEALYREMFEELGVTREQLTMLGHEVINHPGLKGQHGETEHRFIVYLDFKWENKEPQKHKWITPMSIHDVKQSDRELSTYLTSVVEAFTNGEYEKYLSA